MLLKRAGCLVALLFILQVSSPARAQDREKLDKVGKLFQVMHLQATFSQMMNQVEDQSRQMAAGLFPEMNTNPRQKQEFDAYMSDVEKLVETSFSWKAMEPDYAEIYANIYTDSELDSVITFYSSPAGQAFLAKTPNVLRQSSAIAMQRMNEVTPKLRALMDAEVAKLKKAQGSDATTK